LNITDFNSIEDEILLLVDRNHNFDIFLMQEWATYFSSARDAHLFDIQAYFDLDPRKGITRIFNGTTGLTYDQHDGLDASCPKGTEIVSVAEGRVIAIFDGSTVVIRHNNNLVSVYGHGTPLVTEDQFVPRGYPVSLCDDKFASEGPHLHLATWENNPWLPKVIYGIPLFYDLTNPEKKWISYNQPIDDTKFVYILQGSRGIWTEINNPHYPNVDFIEE
jgi:murein DD-endopeptidase MepM/ murein hydrolase activator NlpD